VSFGLSSPIIAATSRLFDLPAGPAEATVQMYARQAHISLLYEPGSLNGFKTRALKGKYEPIEALRLLLDGSGLDFVIPAPRYISVHPTEQPEVSTRQIEILPTVVIDARTSATSLKLPPGVTVRTINAEELSLQGFTTVTDWVRSLTQNQGVGANEGTSYLREALSNVAYGSGLNLYGVGQRATLILVNGQRLAPSGQTGSFTDISNIPLTAVDHIDVMSDGASTIYGADAVGGIVNFVLRGEYARPATTLSLGQPGSLSENVFGQSFSTRGERWRSVWGLEIYSRNGLPASERAQATSNLSAWSGTDYNTSYGNPGTILDRNGKLWGIPAGQNGTHLTATGLLPEPNSYDRYAGTWILPEQRRLNSLFNGSYDLSQETELSLNALLNGRWIKTHNAPPTSSLTVPSTNPFYVNPVPGNHGPIQVLYGFGDDLGAVVEHGTVWSGQMTLGVTHHLSKYWDLEATAGYTFENQLDVENNLVNFGQLQKFIDSNDPNIAFNAFGDGSNTNPLTLAAIRSQGSADYRSAFTTAGLRTVGSFPWLSTGPSTLTAGFDYRLQSFHSIVSSNYSSVDQVVGTNRDRRLEALYLQSSVPVLAKGRGPDVSYELKLGAGLRYEHFNDFGSAVLPSAGASFGTKQGVSVFGTWARMFRPPNLPDLNESVNYATVYPLPDQKSPTGYTNTLVWGGNNAALRPETADSWTVGIQWTPPLQPGISIGMQYYNIVSFHQILPTQLLPINVLNQPQYSYLLTRDINPKSLADICTRALFIGVPDQCQNPDIGAIVDLRLRSAETVKTDGIDLNALVGRETRIGDLSANLQATYILHYEATQAPGNDFLTYRNTAHNPIAVRLRGVFRWENQHMSVSAAVNLQGSYRDTDSSPARPVGAWMTWDFVVGYKLDSLDKMISGTNTLSLRTLNIFNRQPPFLNNSISFSGYDPENGNLLGRRISMRLQHEW
jgi:iron complex outermembrane receptor protein